MLAKRWWIGKFYKNYYKQNLFKTMFMFWQLLNFKHDERVTKTKVEEFLQEQVEIGFSF